MAGATIGTAYFKLAPNMQGVQSKIAAGMKGAGAQATKDLGDEIDSNSGGFQGAIGKLGGIAKAGGAIIAAGIGAGVAGITALTGKMLASGAELEQQLGGSEAVFGQYATDIQNTALNAYKNMGLSQNEFLQGANKMGSLFQGAGFDVQSSMKMSQDSMQRASDIASIMGISTTDALEAVTGMAKGNFTMMDNLGVAMNDTAIGAYAASKGITKSTQAMSIQEKVGLAQQMFMEKTAKYAGNYAKENDTLAGSINTTKKAFDDFLSGGNTIDGFISSLLNTIKIAVPQIASILPQIVDGIGQVATAIIPAIAEVLPTLLPALISAAVGLLNQLVIALPQIIGVLVAALPQFIEGFVKIFIGIVQALPQIITVLVNAIPTIIDSLVSALTNPESLTAIIMGAIQLFLAILKAIPVIIVALVDAIPTIIENIIKTVTSPQYIQMMMKAGIDVFMALIKAIPQILGSIIGAVGKILGVIGDTLSPSNLARIGGDMIKGLWNGISDLTGWVVGKIKGFGDSILGGIKSFFGIHSPSTVFAGIGRDLDRGLAKGITDNASLVDKSVTSMANDALAGMAAVNGSMQAGFNANVTTAQSIQAGEYESAPKVVQYIDIKKMAEPLDAKQVASDLGFMVANA